MKSMDNSVIDIHARIALNDETALAALYQLLYKKLVFFAGALLKSREDAEEIVEDVFVKLWCNRNSVMEIKNLTVYLYVAVKNKSLNLLSAQAKDRIFAQLDYSEMEIDDKTSGPEDLLVSMEMMQQMRDAVDRLPPRCKMIYKLIRDDGLKYKEVAEVLNISVNTIDQHMAVAIKKICAALQIEKGLPKKRNPL